MPGRATNVPGRDEASQRREQHGQRPRARRRRPTAVVCWPAQLRAVTPNAAAKAAATTPGSRRRRVGGCRQAAARGQHQDERHHDQRQQARGRPSATRTARSPVPRSAGRPGRAPPTRPRSARRPPAGREGCRSARSARRRPRPSAPAPSPWSTRPSSSWVIVPAVPATSRPRPKTAGCAQQHRLRPVGVGPASAQHGADHVGGDERQERPAVLTRRCRGRRSRAGIAVPTPMFSKATRLISSTIPTVTARCVGPKSSSRTLALLDRHAPSVPGRVSGAGQLVFGAIGSWPRLDSSQEVPHGSARRGRGDHRQAGRRASSATARSTG